MHQCSGRAQPYRMTMQYLVMLLALSVGLPASALAGGGILVLADLCARTLAAPAELPLGVLTSLVGSPFFFWQLRRTRARQGGWA